MRSSDWEKKTQTFIMCHGSYLNIFTREFRRKSGNSQKSSNMTQSLCSCHYYYTLGPYRYQIFTLQLSWPKEFTKVVQYFFKNVFFSSNNYLSFCVFVFSPTNHTCINLLRQNFKRDSIIYNTILCVELAQYIHIHYL